MSRITLLATAAVALAAFGVSANAAPVNQVAYGSLAGTELVTFDDIAGGGGSGTNYDSLVASNGVGLGEHFAGQAVGTVGDFDTLSATASGPLTLVAGGANTNLNIFTYNGSNVLTGLGPKGFPNFDSVGEGAFAVQFSSDQSEFGFQLVGGNAGNAHISFFNASGGLIDTVIVSNLAEAFYGFSREGAVKDIRGISIWNDDLAGIGFDNLKFDVKSVFVPGAVPEPASWAMMIAGFAFVGSAMRRRSALRFAAA